MFLAPEIGTLTLRSTHFLFQVGETGIAVGIDHINELIKFSQENIQKDSPELLSSNTVKLVG